jgi:alkanesulfonate monooxygenase SsuD/methylene tetrahydromethanopterin reductase-like flavin-dependent oxidoreductase (luciferase family)
MTVSLGIAGALGPDLIARIAVAAEDAGFDALWVNDTPDGDALAGLGAASRGTARLRLATGVIPVDRTPAPEIVAAVRAHEVPPERLVLGIGSGRLREGALAQVGEALDHLRAELPSRVVVGALGPRMRRLGAERGGGVLLNWVPPVEAAEQTRALHAVSPDSHIAVYVRTALDPAAFARLRRESAAYESYPNYAANFARLGVGADATVLEGEQAFDTGLAAYTDAVDEVVLRAVTPTDAFEDYAAFIARAAPNR